MKIKSQKKKDKTKERLENIVKKKKKDKTKDRLVSIVDKDARHGAKSDEKKFTGYKVNSIMSEDGFIKNINATPGNSNSGSVKPFLQSKGPHTVSNTKIYSFGYVPICLFYSF